MCQNYADDFGVHNGNPRHEPILINWKRRRPKPTVNLVHNCLHYRANRAVLLEAWLPYDFFEHHLTNSKIQRYPRRSVVTGVFLATHPSVYTAVYQALRQIRR
jgi:hypothetical protein